MNDWIRMVCQKEWKKKWNWYFSFRSHRWILQWKMFNCECKYRNIKKILLATREIDKSMEFTRGEKNQIKSVKGKNAKKSIIGIYFRYLLFHFASLAFCDLVCFLAITTANSSGKFSKFFCLLEANIPDPTTAQQKFNKIWGLN